MGRLFAVSAFILFLCASERIEASKPVIDVPEQCASVARATTASDVDEIFAQRSQAEHGKDKKIVVEGGFRLKPQIQIAAGKNSTLPDFAGIILSNEPVVLRGLSDYSDITKFVEIFTDMGATVTWRSHDEIVVDPRGISSPEVQSEAASKMRASLFMLGPLLGKFAGGSGKVQLPFPGGCSLCGDSNRSIDLHVYALKKFGVEFENSETHIVAKVPGGESRLEAPGEKNPIEFSYPSVGATENAIGAAVTAKGRTVIKNAAREPEIVGLVEFYRSQGAKISGEGSGTIVIDGVKELKSDSGQGFVHQPIGDRIEAGSYILAALMNRQQVVIRGFNPEHLGYVLGGENFALFNVLDEMNARYEIVFEGQQPVGVKVFGNQNLSPVDVAVLPHPGFPTDLQSPLKALLATVDGRSSVLETVWSKRMSDVPFLNAMGADIEVVDVEYSAPWDPVPSVRERAIINGNSGLEFQIPQGTRVEASDLRAGWAMLMTAMRGQGTFEIHEAQHIYRGYSRPSDNFEYRNREPLRLQPAGL